MNDDPQTTNATGMESTEGAPKACMCGCTATELKEDGTTCTVCEHNHNQQAAA